MDTVSDVRPTRSTSPKKLTTSPTSTGSLNVNELTATVATRPRALRAAKTPPAMSACDMIQPPKMSPCWLTSAGIGTTRSTGCASGSVTRTRAAGASAGFAGVLTGVPSCCALRYSLSGRPFELIGLPFALRASGLIRSRGGPSCSWERAARLVAQLATQDLADVRLGQLAAELDVAWHFVACHVFTAVAWQRIRRQRSIALDGEQLDGLSRLLVGHADDRAFEDTRVHRDNRLDFIRIDVEPRHQDHVLLAVDDAHVAALVHHADVAAREEAVRGNRLCRVFRALPVAGHHLRAADADLAALADRYVVASIDAQGDFRRWHKQADRAVIRRQVERVDRRRGRCLGKAIGLRQRRAGDLLPPPRDRFVHRHGATQREHQRREVELRKTGSVEQRVEKRVDAGDRREAVACHLADQAVDVARIGDQHVLAAERHPRPGPRDG